MFERVRTLAARHEADFPGPSDIARSACRTLLAGDIASVEHFFRNTEWLTPWKHRARLVP